MEARESFRSGKVKNGGDESMDARKLLQAKAALDQVNRNHPKLLPFLKAVEADGLTVGSIIEITVTSPEGKARTANIKLQQSDLDLIKVIRNMQG